jgi:spore coat polysaccharide biosynthesis protein SpsF
MSNGIQVLIFQRVTDLQLIYKEDYDFIKRIYDELYDEKKVFTLCDIMMLLDRKPEIRKLNEKYLGNYWYKDHLDELKTVN